MQEYPKWITNPKTKERVLVADEAQEGQVLGKKKPVEKPAVLDEAQEDAAQEEKQVAGEKKPVEKPKQ
jgi:hypothetical protein